MNERFEITVTNHVASLYLILSFSTTSVIS